MRRPDGTETAFATLEEAAPALDSIVTIALPAPEIMVERLHLPSRDATELEGMTRLQLEKTLPFPPEEITCAHGFIRQEGEHDTVVLGAAVHDPAVDQLCGPLRAAGKLPLVVSLYAAHVAAAGPAGTVLTLYREHGQLMLIVSEERRLSFLQALASDDPALLENELGLVVLNAQMDGIPAEFQAVVLGPDAADLREFVRGFFGLIPQVLALSAISADPPFDLAPHAWEASKRRARGREKLKRRLVLAGLVYLVIVALAVGYVVMLKQRLSSLDRQLAETRPRLEKQQTQQARWESLAPAVLPERSLVEVLFQVLKVLPPGTNVTKFDYTPQQFLIAGESGTASEAIALTEALKKNEALQQFQIDAGPPTLLGNDRAQFKIFGKI